MATAAMTYFRIADTPTLTGLRHFNAAYELLNYNSSIVLCPTPPTLFAAYNDGMTVIITHIDVYFSGTIGTTLLIDAYPGVGQFIHLRKVVAATTSEVISCDNIDIFWGPNNLSNGGNIMAVNSASHGATDDIYIDLRGYVANNMIQGAVPPVSLEGYKWPLVRR